MKLKKNKITALIAEQGLTNVELSKRSGISRQSISTIIRRGSCAPINGGKIAKALGVDVLEIMEEE